MFSDPVEQAGGPDPTAQCRSAQGEKHATGCSVVSVTTSRPNVVLYDTIFDLACSFCLLGGRQKEQAR